MSSLPESTDIDLLDFEQAEIDFEIPAEQERLSRYRLKLREATEANEPKAMAFWGLSIERAEGRILARREISQLLAEHPLGLELRHQTQDRWALIVGDASKAGYWRLQYFDRNGFSGHHTEPSAAKCGMAAVDEHFTIHDPGALDRLAATPAFVSGNQYAAVIQAHNSGKLSWAEATEQIAALR